MNSPAIFYGYDLEGKQEGKGSDGVKDTSHMAKAKDSTLKAKAKHFKVVLEDPRRRGLVLDDSNTG